MAQLLDISRTIITMNTESHTEEEIESTTSSTTERQCDNCENCLASQPEFVKDIFFEKFEFCSEWCSTDFEDRIRKSYRSIKKQPEMTPTVQVAAAAEEEK